MLSLWRWSHTRHALFGFVALSVVAGLVSAVPEAAAQQPTPVSAQPTPISPQPTPVPTPIPLPTLGPPPPPTATPSVISPPPVPHDGRYFAQTGHRVDLEQFWSFFNDMGGLDTFGYPVSRTFVFLGCTTQIFQRQLMQQCGAGPVQTMNLLDPDLMPYNQINFSTFPEHDPSLAQAAPPPGTPNYGRVVLEHLRRVSPDTFQGLPVRFFSTFISTVPGSNLDRDPDTAVLLNLQIWGFPTSHPAYDPTNQGFVYQRFQRGIMHYDTVTGVTRGILLADYFKNILANRDLPVDLAEQSQGSRFRAQYCPGISLWICRPGDLPASDLSFAFEPQ